MNWDLSVFMEGKALSVLHYYYETVTMTDRPKGDDDGPAHQIEFADSLRNKDDVPIPVGGLLRGHIFALVEGDVERARDPRTEISFFLTCTDIHGTKYSSDRISVSGDDRGQSFIKGAKLIDIVRDKESQNL